MQWIVPNSFYYYRYSKPKTNLKFESGKNYDKDYNGSKIPIKTHCKACNLTFSTQKGIDDHYRNPKCLKVQQLKRDLEESDKMPKSIWEPIVLLEDKKSKETATEERIKELESKLSAVSKEKETYKKMLNKEQQQQLKKEKFIESMNLSVQSPNKKVDNHRFAPNCVDATENPSEEGSYFLRS